MQGIEAAPNLKRKVVGVNIMEKHPDQIELHLTNLSKAERRECIKM
jgi:hypothetical protein